jgi:hypothetical protein
VNSERIGPILDTNPELQGLTREAKRLLGLQKLLAELLPSTLVSHTTVAAQRAGDLLLCVDNGASAAKLKQLAPRLAALLHERGVEITGIRIQVQVTIPHKPLPKKHFSLGQEARNALADLAEKLPPSPLRAAIEKFHAAGTLSSDGDQEALHKKQNN